MDGLKEDGSMDSGTKFLTFTSIILVALVLQVLLAVVERKDSPERAAVEFTEAYFWLDKSMGQWLCKSLQGGPESDVVQGYLERVGDTARAMGFERSYMKQALYEVHTHTAKKDAGSALVELRAVRKRVINPIFSVVARIFFVGESHPVEATLDMVKEDGRWKVCGRPLSLVEN
jgi:hypothetical protein